MLEVFVEEFITEIWHLIGIRPSTQEPLHRGHEIQTFGRPLLCHQYYKLSLSDLCQVEMKILKEIVRFHSKIQYRLAFT